MLLWANVLGSMFSTRSKNSTASFKWVIVHRVAQGRRTPPSVSAHCLAEYFEPSDQSIEQHSDHHCHCVLCCAHHDVIELIHPVLIERQDSGPDILRKRYCANVRSGFHWVCSRNLHVFSVWFSKTAHYAVSSWTAHGTDLQEAFCGDQ